MDVIYWSEMGKKTKQEFDEIREHKTSKMRTLLEMM